MPLYAYRCRTCGAEAAELFELGDAPAVLPFSCECGKPFKRIFSPPGIRLRGKGWAKHPDREEANRKRGPQ